LNCVYYFLTTQCFHNPCCILLLASPPAGFLSGSHRYYELATATPLLQGRELGKFSSRPAQYTCICEPDTPYLMTVSSTCVACVTFLLRLIILMMQFTLRSSTVVLCSNAKYIRVILRSTPYIIDIIPHVWSLVYNIYLC
jgi:hypothetical protein